MKKLFLTATILVANTVMLLAQTVDSRLLTMEDVISLAQEKSVLGLTYKNAYLSSYWSFRSYQAEYRPSLFLSSNLVNFNRSLVELQDYQTGEKAFRANYSMNNDVTLTISQNIALTGGTLSLSTSVNRLDQYDPSHRSSYYAQPVYLSYTQSLWGYNRFKWNKKIEPKNYELAKREYIENMEQVAQQAVKTFKALGCSGFSRVDFFVRKSDNAVLFNEINTIPGFTSISMYPKMIEAAGVSYGELCDRLIELAIEKWGK